MAPSKTARGQIGTGAPEPGRFEGWKITGKDERQTGTYFFLNIARKEGSETVTVKARMDGTYLCLQSVCLTKGKRLLHYGDDSYAGCEHAQFVRDQDRGTPTPTDVEPPAPSDEHALSDEERLVDDAPPYDDETEHTPPF